MRGLWCKIGYKTFVKCRTLEVYANLRKLGQCILLAACDVDLLGKILREGKIVFDVNTQFYKGQKMTLEEVIEIMKRSTVVNMVGHNIVKKAVEVGLVHPDAILEISGVPHAQIVRI